MIQATTAELVEIIGLQTIRIMQLEARLAQCDTPASSASSVADPPSAPAG